MISFGVDVGGSGAKGAPVDLDTGKLLAKRFRLRTPRPATPGSVIETIRSIVEHHAWRGPVGVTIPGVVVHGVVRSATNFDAGWDGFDARRIMSAQLGVPVTVLNDADSAGLAEIRYGGHDAKEGVVLMLTFGTGIGSALFHDGVLIPNTEFGQLEFRGVTAEEYAAGRLMKRDRRDIEWWATHANQFLNHMDSIFSPRLIIFGGGISKRFEEFDDVFDTRADVVPARLRNNAGIVGAAMTAATEERE